MERWLRDADSLLAIQPQLEKTVAELQARALPATPAELDRDRAEHPKFAARQRQGAKLAALERAHAIRTHTQVLATTAPTVREESLTPAELNSIARMRVHPDSAPRLWGEEVQALTLARLAWDKSAALPASVRASFGDTLAWAWFANGKDAEAVAQSEVTLSLSADDGDGEHAGSLARLKESVRNAAGAAGEKALAELRASVAALDAELTARRTYRFADQSQQFLHDTLNDLLAKLRSLDDKQRQAVAERREWASRIVSLTLRHPKAPVSWKEAREAIRKADGVTASEWYRGRPIELRDEDVIGLVPIGMNPNTRLWEFYELRSAWSGIGDPASIEIPVHDGEGRIPINEGTGIVFVLLPGGRFTMGSQRDDAARPGYDPQRNPDETSHEVELAPFFLARHEMTKGQWKRLSGGEEPSWYRVGQTYSDAPEPIGHAHPVESVDWSMCCTCLSHHGLVLPTETQWEYGCRAGTTTPWWTGFEVTTLAGAANVLDRRAEARHPEWGRQEGDFDDGRVPLAPVGSYLPNAFGLFDVHGNVFEWTLDGDFGSELPPRAGDGLRGSPADSHNRVLRGGSFEFPSRHARSSARRWTTPSLRYNSLGLRPARRAGG